MLARTTTPEILALAIKRCFDGEAITRVYRETGVPWRQLSDAVKQHGYVPRTGPGLWFSEERAEALRSRYEAGETQRSLAVSFGVGQATISRNLRALGITTRPPGSPAVPRDDSHPRARKCALCKAIFVPPASNPGKYCSKQCRAKDYWLSGHFSSKNILLIDNPRARQRWEGRRSGHLGALEGSQGGRPPVATRDEAAECWRLHREGKSYREISEIVFGDKKFFQRVRRIVAVP
jgi:hypothetical protein